MNKNKKVRIRYDYEYLNNFCTENRLTMLKDYSNIYITRESLIDIKCIKENCKDVCSKKFRELVKHNNFGCKKCSVIIKIDKTKNTCINKYGFNTTLKTIDVKNKIKKTMLEKYGVEYAMQSKNIKEQYKNTCFEKFGFENPSLNLDIKNKVKNTCFEKFGVTNPFQSEEIKNRIKKYNIDKYGFECNSKSKELKNKYRQTCLNKYGCESHTQNDFVKQKIKQSNIIKYGVENVMHDVKIMEKASKNAYKLKEYKFTSGNIIKIQGYEGFALDYLLTNEHLEESNIITGVKNVPVIWYYDKNNKKHRHYVDIYIPIQNRCIEVKSTWTAKQKTDTIMLKQKAAKDMGYNYEIWIYDRKSNRIEVIL